MNSEVEIAGQKLQVEITSSAKRALAHQPEKVFVEMELYFSCLIRKKVRFYEAKQSDEVVYVTDKLGISFRPVMTKVCGNNYEGEEPPITDFPIQKADKFIPKWLKIDFANNEWNGDFGFVS